MRLALLTMTALALAASPLAAQRERKSDVPAKEARAMMHAYAKCIVGRQHAKASEALLANLDNRTILRKYPMLVAGECLRGPAFVTTKMSFSGDLYRYALADALVNKELAALPAPDLARVVRLQHREPGEEPRRELPGGKRMSEKKYQEALKGHREAVGFSYLSKYGECVVRSDPAGAKSLLLTAPDSEGETARFADIQRALGVCLGEGAKLSFGRVALRGTIATNYYRLAHAARAGATKASR
jgi:hypothetical protein